jgi:hypothetical protein
MAGGFTRAPAADPRRLCMCPVDNIVDNSPGARVARACRTRERV